VPTAPVAISSGTTSVSYTGFLFVASGIDNFAVAGVFLHGHTN
jgi:hypothetical protein